LDPGLTFSSCGPQAVDLTRFATVNFQWGGDAKTVFSRYEEVIFPAMALHQLVQSAVDIDKGHAVAGSCSPMIGKILLERTSAKTCFLPEVRVLLIIPSSLIREICASLSGPAPEESVIEEIEENCKKYRAWLPAEIVRTVRPDLFADHPKRLFISLKAKKTKSGREFAPDTSTMSFTGKFAMLSRLHGSNMAQVTKKNCTSTESHDKTHDITVTSSRTSQPGRERKRGRRGNTKIHGTPDGEVWDLSSEDYGESDVSVVLSASSKVTRKRGRRSTVKTIYRLDGTEVLDISSEEYSESG